MSSKRPLRSNLIHHLQDSDLFGALDAETHRLLADGATWHTYTAGETVFWEGASSSGIYFLQDGWLKVVRTAVSGREQVIKFLGPGETFNELGALADQVNPATAIALESAGVWLIHREAVLRLLQERPLFAQYLIKKLAERVTHLVTLVTDLSLRTVQGRLARLLLDETRDNQMHRPSWYTQAEMAARLGTVPDVVQRALRALADDGIIDVARHRIRILDPEKLQQIASE